MTRIGLFFIVGFVLPNVGWADSAVSRPAGALEDVYSSLQLSDKDKLLLSSVRDGTDPVEQNGFYRMMRIVGRLPKLSGEELRRLDAPAWANLLRQPERYRLHPIRLTVRVYVVRELILGKGWRANPYWPDEEPIYELHGTIEGSPDEPLMLYTARKPEKLGPISETLPDKRVRYKNAPPHEVACVYLQSYTETSTDGQKRKYPVLLAWQMNPTKASGSLFGTFTSRDQYLAWGAGFLVLVAAAAVFVFVQRRVKRPTAAQRGPVFKKYKPLRDEESAGVESEDDEFVDPDLAMAVEEYQKDHPHAKNEDTP
ncbi:MAG: hypothetical protein JXA11_06045 [Phycisphaerae bacterium]|nr:hypothetical protein [Phycisphaerae bacterium]